MCRDMAAQARDPQAALLSDLAALKLQEVAQPRSARVFSGAPLTAAWPTLLLRAGRCRRGGAAVQESPGGPAAAASRRHRRRRRRRLGGSGQLGRCALDFLPNHFADLYARPVAQGQRGQREARQQDTIAHHMPRSLGRGQRTTAAARRPRSSVTRRRGRLGGGSGSRRRLVPQPASSLRRRHLWRRRPRQQQRQRLRRCTPIRRGPRVGAVRFDACSTHPAPGGVPGALLRRPPRAAHAQVRGACCCCCIGRCWRGAWWCWLQEAAAPAP